MIDLDESDVILIITGHINNYKKCCISNLITGIYIYIYIYIYIHTRIFVVG